MTQRRVDPLNLLLCGLVLLVLCAAFGWLFGVIDPERAKDAIIAVVVVVVFGFLFLGLIG